MASPKRNVFTQLVIDSAISAEDKDTFLHWATATEQQLQESSKLLLFSDLLATIPVLPNAGCVSLACLTFILTQFQAQFSFFDIARFYTRLWLALPEASKAGHDEGTKSLLQDAYDQVCLAMGTFRANFNSSADTPALVDPKTDRTLTHRQLSAFIRSFALPLHQTRINSTPIVAIALPNGYLLGLACLAVSSYYTAAPLNIAGGASQFRSDVELAGPCCVLVLSSDVGRLGLNDPWATEAEIQILLMEPQEDMTFRVKPLLPPTSEEVAALPTPNMADDLALILFTSGTSGTKKVVPITCLGLLIGVQCVIDSWGLTPTDTCLNMMPLNHVGGLVRNLFAPIFSGGSTILCPSFDPNLFWDILESGQGTWYYASPSMHMSILAEAALRGDAIDKCKLRLVCNAAGGLLPALAALLKHKFACTVLPSYGMTECMPISTPPLDYTLDRIGTSGIACGPEISILDASDNRVLSGAVGRICVRGGPTFPGYLKGGKIDRSAFNKDGWFDTGDLGSLDSDGYLYLTGRSKEVINRGGEIISPFEVEEAITLASQDPNSNLFGRVQQVLAFSAPHQVLQEVVGVALVTSPMRPRPDIRDLHAVLKSSLHSVKWPIVLVYMDALPTSNNKLMRINLAERMDIPIVTNEMTLPERHFEGICPPVNSTLRTKISSKACVLDSPLLQRRASELLGSDFDTHVGISHHDGTPILYVAPTELSRCGTPDGETIERLHASLKELLDGILIPSSITALQAPFPRRSDSAIDEVALDVILKEVKHTQASPEVSETELKIRKAFAEVLNFSIDEMKSESDFFALGGESLSAGHLLSLIRRDIGVRIPVDQLFTSSKISELCSLVERIIQHRNKPSDLSSTVSSLPGCTETYSSTNPFVLIVHALPIVLFYPLKMAFQWTVLMYSLSTVSQLWDEPNIPARFLALVASMFISRASTQIVAPLFGIAFKWVVIGRYKQGMYPMWGGYHTRWWIVEKVLRICGKGVFRYLDATRLIYLRLLGAKIGKGVTIEKGTTLGEYDLLDVGDNVHLDRCICRPFAVEMNTSMYLGHIKIGANSSIGLKSHIAAGSTIPEDTFIGANSSSYEMDNNDTLDCRRAPKPNPWLQIFCIMPIQILVMFISSLPWMGGLFGIVMSEPVKSTDSVKTVIMWWATPHRISFHYLAQALNVAVRPFFWFAVVVVIKRLLNFFCGRATPKAAEDRTQGDLFRSQLLNSLVPHGGLKSLTKLFGTHYEFTSMAVRAMGGRVGKRVYWPGTGPSIEDFDLLDIGDDVVFGSRSHIITSDAFGSDTVHIGSGAMIADRVVLSPGTTIGARTVLGSGAFIKRNQDCVPDSVWIGNRYGSAVCLSSSSASTMVGRMSKNGDDPEKDAIVSYPVSQGTSIFSRSPSYPGSLKSPNGSDSKVFFESSVNEVFNGQEEMASAEGSSSSLNENKNQPSPTPFGRAFYDRQAPYYVLNQFTIFLYSTLITIFTQLFWNVATISTIILSQFIKYRNEFQPRWYRPLKVYAFDVAILSLLLLFLSLLSLAITIVAKWALLGRRKPGSYDWDKSSYCQRWQLFLSIEAIRRRCFGGNGVLGMLTGSWYCVLYFRLMGATIGKDCALFAGGRPSLMFTEPDLLTLGERVSVDDASLVGHVNSRGKFSLNELSVGDRSVLRSGSRLLSGARMGRDCVLLEHTLIMAGDVADDGVTYQGWPADVFRGERLNVVSRIS